MKKLFLHVGLVLCLFAVPLAADAFDDYGIGCADDVSASIAFSSQGDWNRMVTMGPDSGKTLKAAVQDGRNMWIGSEIEHWSGGAALSGGSPTMQMEFVDIPWGTAVTSCPEDKIRFDEDAVEDLAQGAIVMSGLAAHEWGHVWGLGHAGRWDSAGGGSPTMSTCWNDMADQRFVSQDDSAGIQFQTNKAGSYGAATANSSFEEGTRWWGFQNVNYTKMFYSGGQDGSPNYLRYGGPASNTAVYSTTRITDSWYDGNEIGANIKGRANYKKYSSLASGYVKVVAKWRHVDYPGGGSDPQCQLSPANLNDWPNSGPYEFQTVKYCYPTNSWGYCTTSDVYVVSTDSGKRKAEGVDIRIVVYNRMTVTYGGETDYVPVDVDRVRALVIPS